jgi:hypothetical protein
MTSRSYYDICVRLKALTKADKPEEILQELGASNWAKVLTLLPDPQADNGVYDAQLYSDLEEACILQLQYIKAI